MALADEVIWSDNPYTLKELKESRFTYPLLVKVDGGLYGSLDERTFSSEQLMLLHKWEESERVIATGKKTGLQITIPIEHQHKLEVYMKHKEKKAGRTGKPGKLEYKIKKVGLYTTQSTVRNFKPPVLARFDPDRIAEFYIDDKLHDSSTFGLMELENVHYIHYIKASTIDDEGIINTEVISILPVYTEIELFVGKGMLHHPTKHFTRVLHDLARRAERLVTEATGVYMSGIQEYEETMDIDYEEINESATWGRRKNKVVKLPLPQIPEENSPNSITKTVCIVKPTRRMKLPWDPSTKLGTVSEEKTSKGFEYHKVKDGPLGYEIPVPSVVAAAKESEYYNDPLNTRHSSRPRTKEAQPRVDEDVVEYYNYPPKIGSETLPDSSPIEDGTPPLPPSDKEGYWPLWRTGLRGRKTVGFANVNAVDMHGSDSKNKPQETGSPGELGRNISSKGTAGLDKSETMYENTSDWTQPVGVSLEAGQYDSPPPLPQKLGPPNKLPIISKVPPSSQVTLEQSGDQGFQEGNYDDTMAPKGAFSERNVTALIANLENKTVATSSAYVSNEPCDVPPLPEKKTASVHSNRPKYSNTSANRPLPLAPPGPYRTRFFHHLREVPKDISEVGISGISDCLHLLNLEHCIARFAENQIDGRLLQNLSKEGLIKAFDMSDLQAEKILMFAQGAWRPKS